MEDRPRERVSDPFSTGLQLLCLHVLAVGVVSQEVVYPATVRTVCAANTLLCILLWNGFHHFIQKNQQRLGKMPIHKWDKIGYDFYASEIDNRWIKNTMLCKTKSGRFLIR